ncbi:MAG: pilus assembly protein PilM, partial [Planctomycetota bacterium]
MARAIGLDIGNRLIKVVELGGTPKVLKVQRLVIREIPAKPPPAVEGEPIPDPDAALSETLAEIFGELKLPKDDVCATFAAGSTVFREIMVPFTADEQIRKVVTFEAENHLHSHSIEDVVVNWVKTAESRDGSRLTIFASPKEPLAESLEILRGAGIEPASMDLDATAVYTACEAAGIFESHPNVILFDIGARSTAVILVTNGRPTVMRSFLLGASHLERQVGRDLQVPAMEAQQRTRLPTGPRADDLLVPASSLEPPSLESEKSLAQIQSEAVADQRMNFVRKLHREGIRSLASIRSDAAPELILLTGGGSLLPDLDAMLAEKFELPVERLDLTSRFEFKDPGPDPELAAAVTPAAIGCGLRMMGYNPLGVELLKDEFAPTNTFDVIKTALATAVTLLFVTLLGLAIIAKTRRDAETRRYNFAASKAESLFKTAETAYLRKVENKTEEGAKEALARRLARYPKDETRADQFIRLLRSRHRTLENELGLTKDMPPVRSGLEVWLEV